MYFSLLSAVLLSLPLTLATPNKRESPEISHRKMSLLRRDLCTDIGEVACDDKCMPPGDVCCKDGSGTYCFDGYYCTDDGCCPDGETCSGPGGTMTIPNFLTETDTASQFTLSNLPTISISTPTFDTSSFSIPSLSAPSLSAPSLSVPSLTLPSIPSVSIPSATQQGPPQVTEVSKGRRHGLELPAVLLMVGQLVL